MTCLTCLAPAPRGRVITAQEADRRVRVCDCGGRRVVVADARRLDDQGSLIAVWDALSRARLIIGAELPRVLDVTGSRVRAAFFEHVAYFRRVEPQLFSNARDMNVGMDAMTTSLGVRLGVRPLRSLPDLCDAVRAAGRERAPHLLLLFALLHASR